MMEDGEGLCGSGEQEDKEETLEDQNVAERCVCMCVRVCMHACMLACVCSMHACACQNVGVLGWCVLGLHQKISQFGKEGTCSPTFFGVCGGCLRVLAVLQ